MRLRRVTWNPWQSNGKLRNMKNRSFEVLFHKQIRIAWRRMSSWGNPDGVAPDSMAARVLLGNPDGVALDSNARSVSSGGGVPTLCTRRRSPFAVRRHSSFHSSRNSVRSMFHLLRIIHIRRLTPDGRGGRFNFPEQTCPDPLIALTRRVFLSVYSATEFLLKLPDISDRHLEIFCFRYLMSNPQTLLVTHLS